MSKMLNGVFIGFLFVQVVSPAFADDKDRTPSIDIDLNYTADGIAIMSRDDKDKAYWLDNIDLTATLDLQQIVGWKGATAHVDVLSNLGGNPNNRAVTLQGVDNIEVASQRIRLFEAWVEQQVGTSTSVRLGLYNLNSEFYVNDAAAVLVAPAFGVGSEIAATGPNGPSIFPSTALSVRIDHRIAKSGYVRFAVLNASAGTLGDVNGVNLSFNAGALLIGEAGLVGDAGHDQGSKIAAGVWTYTRRQNDVRAIDVNGDPRRRNAHGVYVVAEHAIGDPEAAIPVMAFARIGVSDGRTTPFRGGWQAGFLVSHPIPGRSDGELSIGANQGYLSSGYRQILEASGITTAAAETAFELTYSDQITPNITLQPDLQMVLDSGGDKSREPVFVAGLRVKFGL